MNIIEKISEKIEDIRRQPEHTRMRYVWGSVAVSMFFIVAIWIFSMSSLFQGDENYSEQKTDNSSGISQQLENLKQQAPSLNDLSEGSLEIMSEGVINPTR